MFFCSVIFLVRLFSRSDLSSFIVGVVGEIITSKKQFHVQGIIFYSKMQWGPQVTFGLKKANKALIAIFLIRNHFNTPKLLQLITSNYYSILYFNSEAWKINTLTMY